MREYALTSETARSDGLSASCIIDNAGRATVRLRNKSKEDIRIKFREFLSADDLMRVDFYRLDKIVKIKIYREEDGEVSGIYVPISEDLSRVEEKEIIIQKGKEFVMSFSSDELFDREYYPNRLVSMKSSLDEGRLGSNFFYQVGIEENGKCTAIWRLLSEINLWTKTDVSLRASQ